MSSPAIQRLESLLQTRKLDSTVLNPATAVARTVASTGVAAIDGLLGGGWPCGEMSELIGARSTGRTAVLIATLAEAVRAGGIVSLVDTFDRFDPDGAAAAGLDLDRLLWVRGPQLTIESLTAFGRAVARPAAHVEQALQQAIRAADLIVRAGGFGVVALDLGDVPPRWVRAFPFTTWLRLAHANEGRDAACLLVGDAPIGRSARGVSIRLEATRVWAGAHAQSRWFTGFQIRPHASAGSSPQLSRHESTLA
jgi:hypothetical protein